MNGWLMETGHANAEFILNADDAIDRAGQWREQPQHMLEAVLRATLPGQRRTAQREDEILGQFIQRMQMQGLRNVAQSCLSAWYGPNQKKIYAAARTYIDSSETLARDTEERRRTRTLKAAQTAGYGR